MDSNFTYEIRQLPFVRLLLYFILGIIFQINVELSFSLLYTLPAFIALLVVSKKLIPNFRSSYASGVVVFVLLFFAGISVVQKTAVKPVAFPDKTTRFIAIVDSQPEEKENSYKALLKIILVKKDSLFSPQEFLILSYLAKDSSSRILKYGDKIILSARLSKLSNSGNPNEFDYARYLKRKGIIGQTYLQSGKWAVLGVGFGFSLYDFAFSLRDKLIKIYKLNGIAGQNLAVLSALTLGDKSELSPQTKQAYSSSGAMHVLAVSGLHVGIIYVIIGFLLKFLDRLYYRKIPYGKFIKMVSIIAFLWFFALLSGLSPSVRRAALMFSFFVVGSVLNRPGSIYNSLASSAFVLLAINPYLLFEVGFQMSYLAVFSIVFIQPKLYNTLNINNKWIDKLWALTTVSIAAQLGTTPLSLYFFHQFPNWFMLTNLAVIPLATVIVYGAAILFAVSPFSILSKWVAMGLDFVVGALNYAANFVKNLPFPATYNITFRTEHLLLSYLGIIALLLFFILKKSKLLRLAIGLFLVLATLSVTYKIIYQTSARFIVYNSSKLPIYNFISGNKNIVLGDTALLNLKSRTLDFAAKGFWLQSGLADFELKRSKSLQSKYSEFIQFKGKRMAIIRDKKEVAFTTKNPLKMDYVILSGNLYISIDELLNLYSPELIIFDSSNKKIGLNAGKKSVKP